jgi:hypothetical protein
MKQSDKLEMIKSGNLQFGHSHCCYSKAGDIASKKKAIKR